MLRILKRNFNKHKNKNTPSKRKKKKLGPYLYKSDC